MPSKEGKPAKSPEENPGKSAKLQYKGVFWERMAPEQTGIAKK